MYKDWYRYGLRRERERVPDLKTGLKLPPPNDVRTNGAERKLVINRRPEKNLHSLTNPVFKLF